jgi:hypothetical protein
MEGDGPLSGTPKALGTLIMGCDPLAVDATCCRLMQLDAQRIPYLVLGHRRRLGRLHAPRIKQIGEAIEAVAQPFETTPGCHHLCIGITLVDRVKPAAGEPRRQDEVSPVAHLPGAWSACRGMTVP